MREAFNPCQAAVIPYYQIVVVVVGGDNSVDKSVVSGRDLREVLLCIGERSLQKFFASNFATSIAPGLPEEVSRLFHGRIVG